MKLEPVTKLDKRNKLTSKNFYNDAMLADFDVIAIFSNLLPVWSNPETGFWTQSAKLTISLKVTPYLTKTENRTKKSLTQLSPYCSD